MSTIVSAAAVHNAAMAARPDLADVLQSARRWTAASADLDASFFQRRDLRRRRRGALRQLLRALAHRVGRSRSAGARARPIARSRRSTCSDSLANDPRFVLNMHFRPGDIQFLNNYKIWHARTSYVDYPEPERQRDLYRLWLTLRVPMHLPDDFRHRRHHRRGRLAFG